MEDLEGLHYHSVDSNLEKGWNSQPRQSSDCVGRGQEQGHVFSSLTDLSLLWPPDDLHIPLFAMGGLGVRVTSFGPFINPRDLERSINLSCQNQVS